jgi:hypothetical protein
MTSNPTFSRLISIAQRVVRRLSFRPPRHSFQIEEARSRTTPPPFNHRVTTTLETLCEADTFPTRTSSPD